MKRETIFAIIFGISLGVIVAVLVIFRSNENKFLKSKPINNQTKNLTPKTNLSDNSPFIDISSPTDKVVTQSNTVILKGRANKNSLIIIQSPIKELLFKNNKEAFEKEFPLALGENVIEFTNYPDDKNIPSVNKQLRVYYLPTEESIE